MRIPRHSTTCCLCLDGSPYVDCQGCQFTGRDNLRLIPVDEAPRSSRAKNEERRGTWHYAIGGGSDGGRREYRRNRPLGRDCGDCSPGRDSKLRLSSFPTPNYALVRILAYCS